MSGFILVFNRERVPVEPTVMARMMAALAHRGPDGADTCLSTAVGLGHLHFWTTPEEVGERQPLADASGRVHLVFDGRLDNRKELLGTLACANPKASDAAL